jgi:hypothetical protein
MSTHPCLSWTLRSIARIERAGGVRPPRLTEAGFAHWHRIRRRLEWRDFAALLHEDLAEAFPFPFDVRRWRADPFVELDSADAERLIREAAAPDDQDAHTFLRAAARGLDLPSTGSLSDVPRTQPHQKVLELGFGRVAAWQVLSQPGLAFHDQFVFVADSDAERVLVGLSAVEARANAPQVLTSAEARALIKKGQRFDRVVGLRTTANEQLAAELGVEARWA